MTNNHTDKSKSIESADGRITAEILKRDRFRVRFWTTLAVVSWLLVAALFAVTQYIILVFLQPKLIQIWTEPEVLTETGARELRHNLVTFYQFLTATNICWAVMLLIAAGITIKLVATTRGVTLRKIQSDLAGISSQLSRMVDQPAEPT